MAFLEPIAGLLGVSVGQLTTLAVVGVALLVGWYVLKGLLKLAVRAFSIGCLGILVLVAGLYAVFVLAR